MRVWHCIDKTRHSLALCLDATLPFIKENPGIVVVRMSSDESQGPAGANKNDMRNNKRARRGETAPTQENNEADTRANRNSQMASNKRAPLQPRNKRARKTTKRAPKRAAAISNAAPPQVKARHVTEDVYAIDAILDKRINAKGGEEFLVSWKNCSESDNTWEPSENLCDTAFAWAESVSEQGESVSESKLKESEEYQHSKDGSGKGPSKKNGSKAAPKYGGETKRLSQHRHHSSKKLKTGGKPELKSTVRLRAPVHRHKKQRTKRPPRWTEEDRRLVQASYLASFPHSRALIEL